MPAKESIDLEALKKEIMAEMKAGSAREEVASERKRREALADAKKDTVEIELFKDDDRYTDDVTVAVNGEIYKIQRGVRVAVPRFVAEVIETSMQQDRNTANLIRKYEADYKRLANSGVL